MAAAFDRGADGVEVDLRLTADGVLAVSHDEDLHRLTGVPLAIADSPWAALVETAEQRGVQLARAEQVLGQAAGRLVVLEVKEPSPGRTSGYGTAVAVAELLKKMRHAGVDLDVTVSSFAPDIIATVRELLPDDGGVRTALLGRPEDRATALLRQAVARGHDELHPHVSSVLAEAGVVAAGRANGVVVVPWTVNARRVVQRLEMLGAHGLITDVPETARTALSRVTV